MQQVKTKGYALRCDNIAALAGVQPCECSLEASAGEIVLLWGPRYGREALAEVIAGLRRPAGGEMQILGKECRQWSWRQLRQWVGYVPEHPVLRSGSIVDAFGGSIDSDEIEEMLVQFAPALGTNIEASVASLAHVERLQLATCIAVAQGAQIIVFPLLDSSRPKVNAFVEALRADAAQSGRLYIVQVDDPRDFDLPGANVWFGYGGQLRCGGYWVSRDVWLSRESKRMLKDLNRGIS